MNRKHFLACLASLAALWSAGACAADPYPMRPIELIVPFPAGGVTDMVARAFAQSAAKFLPQPFIVNNKPGASGTIGMAEVALAKPDGYKLTMLVPELLIAPKLGIGKVTYNDLTLLARFTAEPNTLTVRADAPWTTLEEFIAYARAHPGAVSLGTSGTGSIYNVAIAALNDRTGIKLSHIPYQGEAPATVGLLGGQTDATTLSFTPTVQHIHAGKLRVLGVMSEKRYPGFENVPTFKERGINVVFNVWRAIGGPKGLPPEVAGKLREVIRNVAADPAFKKALEQQTVELVYQDADEFRSALVREDEELKTLMPKLDLSAR